ncbi:probable enoyl-CoA hydratase 1, peroxisomal [Orussus abietinus]|uniref:probable enoyl-CoA hydratase 1, peroxisomal n=1 Tax=Orussus abietinus TaxID=222816 RepID=UPI000625C287|nr:probable enoyl-CoA hydratase 1, peroxisomal [Orussus abietinus]
MICFKYFSRSIRKACKDQITRTLTSQPATDAKAIESSEEKCIVVDRIGAVMTIGINRPEKRNCLDTKTALSLANALDSFDHDSEALVGILHGIGGNFCAGYDLHEIAQYTGDSEDNVPHFGPLCNRTSLSNKPLIGVMVGFTIGVGFELSLMCDLRICEHTTVMGLLNRRFGIPMLCGGTVRLPAMIGYSRALDLILTGRSITGEEAYNWGLCNQLVQCGSGLGRGISLAQSLTKFPQRTLLADRRSAHAATFGINQIEEALQFEKDNASHLLLEEGVAGAKKFVNGIGRHGKSYNLTKMDRISFKRLSDDML